MLFSSALNMLCLTDICGMEAANGLSLLSAEHVISVNKFFLHSRRPFKDTYAAGSRQFFREKNAFKTEIFLVFVVNIENLYFIMYHFSIYTIKTKINRGSDGPFSISSPLLCALNIGCFCTQCPASTTFPFLICLEEVLRAEVRVYHIKRIGSDTARAVFVDPRAAYCLCSA